MHTTDEDNKRTHTGELVSIVIPVYNAESTLEKCLSSVKNQNYYNIEVVIIDDGSTDNTSAICQGFCNNDKRFHYYRQNNAGVSSARNHGIEKATGQYICFCDSDDWVEPEIYEVLSRIMNKKECDIAICGFIRHRGIKTDYHAPDREEYMDRYRIGQVFWEYQNRELWGSPCNKMYRKELIVDLFDINMNCGEDMVFNMNYMHGKQCYGFTEMALYNVYSPDLKKIKYPDMNAQQTLVYSRSLGFFLKSIMRWEEYGSSYQRFLCDNFCRDTVTIALSKSFSEANRLIGEYYAYPEIQEVLKKRIYMISGWKYRMTGTLLHYHRVKLLIIAMKMFGVLKH